MKRTLHLMPLMLLFLAWRGKWPPLSRPLFDRTEFLDRRVQFLKAGISAPYLTITEKTPESCDPPGLNRHELRLKPIGSRLDHLKAVQMLPLRETHRMAPGLNAKVRDHGIACQFQNAAAHSQWRLL
jgi:hypothetical protein